MKTSKSALIVVDVQNDFCPEGALAVPHGDEIVPVINNLLPKFDLVIFTKDWHPIDNIGFASRHGVDAFDKLSNGEMAWPDHCVQDTPGADLHSGIDFSKCKKDFYIWKKGDTSDAHPYSAMEGEEPELVTFLDEKGIDDVFVCGLALDYCVKATAIDAAMNGFKSVVIEDACKPIDENINPTLQEFKEAGVYFIESYELEMFNALHNE